MATRFEPVELIPVEQIPPSEVLRAGTGDISRYDRMDNQCDIFPLQPDPHYRAAEALLAYGHANPKEGEPLYRLHQGIRIYRHDIYAMEEADDWKQSEETLVGLSTTMLYGHLIRGMDGAYSALVEQGSAPETAVTILDNFIDERQKHCYTDYTERVRTAQVAAIKLERPQIDIPATDDNDLYLASLSKAFDELTANENGRLQRAAYYESRIVRYKRRLERLEFEAFAARTILDVLEVSVT